MNAQQLMQSLTKAMHNALNLRIVTVVADGKVEHLYDQSEMTFTLEDDQKVAFTNVDLLSGDVSTSYHPDYLDPKNDTLRKLHEKQVDLARKIVENNLKLVSSLINELWTQLQIQPEEKPGEQR